MLASGIEPGVRQQLIEVRPGELHFDGADDRHRGGDGFEQNPEVQEMSLREMVARRGWTIARVYSDRMSGAKENRPGLKSLMDDARRGQFDVVLVGRFDRFARSIEQLVTALAEFRALGIDFVSGGAASDVK